MKTQIINFTFIIFIFLTFKNSYSCGDHDNSMLSQGGPLIHNSFLKKHEKQFPDPNTHYSPLNSDHRGITRWETSSLDHSHTLALTFDDGPHPVRTPKLLDTLKKYDVKATFFVLGNLARKFPEIIKRIIREGHQIASHDYYHNNANNKSQFEFKQELKKAITGIAEFNQSGRYYYRFPYGAYGNAKGYHHFNVLKELSNELFADNCINFAFWDIDTSDWVSNMTPQNIVQTLFSNLFGGTAWRFIKKSGQYRKESYFISNPKGGGVVLMHDIHQQTIEAVELFLKQALQKNIQFTQISYVQEFDYHGLFCELI